MPHDELLSNPFHQSSLDASPPPELLIPNTLRHWMFHRLGYLSKVENVATRGSTK